ncbi:hypothetical protein [Desulfoluna sp.]|uniref:hypothetical protein n=1 Tax=Desulfoluna sp. TaxID=2045199 RepID=UPI0026205FDD|nr:hypothetical protein [Desulfoluna sp.]
MKKVWMIMGVFLFITVATGRAHADLGAFLEDLNLQAKADMTGFSLRLSRQFEVPLQKVESIIKTVDFPADAFMCLQLGEMAGSPPERAVHAYKRNREKGWGAAARDLGIKPGSQDFHALKRGDFMLNGEGEGVFSEKRQKGKSQGKGKNKGKGKIKGSRD